jgi:nucleoside-diphosphate-sugar epimerase
MQTILGSGGAIATELAKALPKYTDNIRLVSRNPQAINDTDQTLSADLLDPIEVLKAVQGSEIVYVTIGFPYQLKIWRENWPKFIRSVIDACAQEKCKLVFFDNIYMYDVAYLGDLTEETPFNPPSKKGQIRAQIAEMIIQAYESGKINGLIARCADFYGPGIKQTSVLTETVFKPFSQGKKATWMGSVDHPHSFTYTPDAGKATALLGNTPEAYNQTWHLPTSAEPFTGKDYMAVIAKEMGTKDNYMTIPKFLIQVMGFFDPLMRELPEMTYQYTNEYFFNSSKFEQYFNSKPTPYLQGIKEVVAADYSK